MRNGEADFISFSSFLCNSMAEAQHRVEEGIALL